MGLSLPPSMNPLSETGSTAPSTILYYLAAMLWVTLDLHHWTLIGFQKSYEYLPVGAAHVSEPLATALISRTSGTFLVALQMSAPIMAVSFIITLVFSVLGRAVPQMNVFVESYAIRTLVGLSVFGLSMQLMSQHIVNYLRRLPEDLLNVSHLIAAG
jgi:flagellar biosynthetic protein FliR